MSKAHLFQIDKFKRDLHAPAATKRGGVHRSRLAGHEVYFVKANNKGRHEKSI
jgi:hypothetical protein